MVPSQLEELEWPASALMFWTLRWLFLLPSLCKERKVYLSCHPEPTSTAHYHNLISEDKGSTHLRQGTCVECEAVIYQAGGLDGIKGEKGRN